MIETAALVRLPFNQRCNMRAMARRLPFLWLAFSFGLAGTLHADIGFSQAAATSRLLNPGRTLVSLRHRVTNNGAQYNTGCIDGACTQMHGVDLNAANGFVIGIAVEPLLPPEDAAMRDVMDRIDLVEFDFADALAAARTATGRPDSAVARIDLVSELLLVFYDLRYADGTRLMVDGVTGEVLPLVDTATSANSLSPVAMYSQILRAQAAAGPGWHPFLGETAVTQSGVAVGITLLDPQTGHLKQVDMLGKQTQVIEFTPIGHLATVVAEVRPHVATTVVSLGQFLARVEHDFPGGRLSALGLQAQLQNGATRVTWSASVLTALNQPLEFAVDAMVPIDASLGIATAPRDFPPGDLNHDGHVTGEDLAEMLYQYNQPYPPYDLDLDGFVKGEDLAILLVHWG